MWLEFPLENFAWSAKRSRRPFTPSVRQRQSTVWRKFSLVLFAIAEGTNAYGVIVAKLRQSKGTTTDHCPDQLGHLA
jgi:hypothetical protein